MTVLHPESRYSKRLNQVLNFASQNNHKYLKLDLLADMACMSKYHFARVFHDQLGESPIQFLKRIRLERAACLIRNQYLPISEIATNSGFTSNQTFAREFGKKFDLGPRRFRLNHLNQVEENNGISSVVSSFKEFHDIGIHHDLEESAERIQIVRKLPTKVAYVRSIGRYGGCNEIGKAMDAIRDWALETGHWHDDTKIIGASWDYSSMTPETMCRYDSCVPVPDDFVNNSGVSVQTIPGGLYAVAQTPYRSIKDACLIWHWFSLTLRTAARFKNYVAKLYTGPWYEIYKFDPGTGKPVAELYAYLYSTNKQSDYIYKL